MAYGDIDYQVNDLTKRLAILEGRVRATSTASIAKAVPDSPLQSATSTGQGIAGVGLSQEVKSRALQTALGAAFAGVESIEDTLVNVVGITFPGGTPVTLHDTAVRPDPVVGESYRVFASGELQNLTVSNAAVGFGFTFGGSATVLLSPAGAFTILSGESRHWWVVICITVNTAGAPGRYSIGTRATDTVASLGGPNVVAQDFINAGNFIAGNFVSPHFVLLCIPSIADANLKVFLENYVFERLGTRQG